MEFIFADPFGIGCRLNSGKEECSNRPPFDPIEEIGIFEVIGVLENPRGQCDRVCGPLIAGRMHALGTRNRVGIFPVPLIGGDPLLECRGFRSLVAINDPTPAAHYVRISKNEGNNKNEAKHKDLPQHGASFFLGEVELLFKRTARITPRSAARDLTAIHTEAALPFRAFPHFEMPATMATLL